MGTVAAGMIFAQAQTPASAQTPAQTQNPQPNQPAKPMNHRATARRRMFEELNLSAAQKEHARAIFQQARAASKPIREQMKQNREAMAAAVKADNKTQIERLSATRGELMGKLTAQRTEAMAKFYQELTPQQRAKAGQLHQRAAARMHRRMQQHKAIG